MSAQWVRVCTVYQEWFLDGPSQVESTVTENSRGVLSAHWSCCWGYDNQDDGRRDGFASADDAKAWTLSEIRSCIEAKRAELDGLLKALDGVT